MDIHEDDTVYTDSLQPTRCNSQGGTEGLTNPSNRRTGRSPSLPPETRGLVSTELSIVRNGIEQFASKLTLGQDEIQTSLRMGHDHLRWEV